VENSIENCVLMGQGPTSLLNEGQKCDQALPKMTTRQHLKDCYNKQNDGEFESSFRGMNLHIDAQEDYNFCSTVCSPTRPNQSYATLNSKTMQNPVHFTEFNFSGGSATENGFLHGGNYSCYEDIEPPSSAMLSTEEVSSPTSGEDTWCGYQLRIHHLATTNNGCAWYVYFYDDDENDDEASDDADDDDDVDVDDSDMRGEEYDDEIFSIEFSSEILFSNSTTSFGKNYIEFEVSICHKPLIDTAVVNNANLQNCSTFSSFMKFDKNDENADFETDNDENNGGDGNTLWSHQAQVHYDIEYKISNSFSASTNVEKKHRVSKYHADCCCDNKNNSDPNDDKNCNKASKKKKRVHFPTEHEDLVQVHRLVAWSYAYKEARRGITERCVPESTLDAFFL